MAVSEILTNFQGVDALKQLLWSELNYERANTPLSRRGWPDGASQCLEEDPLLLLWLAWMMHSCGIFRG